MNSLGRCSTYNTYSTTASLKSPKLVSVKLWRKCREEGCLNPGHVLIVEEEGKLPQGTCVLKVARSRRGD